MHYPCRTLPNQCLSWPRETMPLQDCAMPRQAVAEPCITLPIPGIAGHLLTHATLRNAHAMLSLRTTERFRAVPEHHSVVPSRCHSWLSSAVPERCLAMPSCSMAQPRFTRRLAGPGIANALRIQTLRCLRQAFPGRASPMLCIAIPMRRIAQLHLNNAGPRKTTTLLNHARAVPCYSPPPRH